MHIIHFPSLSPKPLKSQNTTPYPSHKHLGTHPIHRLLRREIRLQPTTSPRGTLLTITFTYSHSLAPSLSPSHQEILTSTLNPTRTSLSLNCRILRFGTGTGTFACFMFDLYLVESVKILSLRSIPLKNMIWDRNVWIDIGRRGRGRQKHTTRTSRSTSIIFRRRLLAITFQRRLLSAGTCCFLCTHTGIAGFLAAGGWGDHFDEWNEVAS
jgi:hypothetical protein